MDYTLGPLEGYRMLITRISEPVNGLAYLAGVGGAQVAQNSSGQNAEPHLHLVQPGGMGRCVMEMDQGVAGRPTVVLGLMGAQVVQYDMQLRIGMLGYHAVHEVQELADAAGSGRPLRSRCGLPRRQTGWWSRGACTHGYARARPAHWRGAAILGRAPEPGWRASRPR